jgi:Rieske Fe-S protein
MRTRREPLMNPAGPDNSADNSAPSPLPSPLPAGLRRRTVLGASVVGAVGAAGLLSACGGGGDTAGDSGTDASPSDPPSGASSSEGGSAGGALVKTSKVPVNGGVVLQGKKIVVTQPTDGDFKAFTAVCTHMNCLVGMVRDGIISCPCHGSEYSAADGSVKQGPAPRALASVAIKAPGDVVVAPSPQPQNPVSQLILLLGLTGRTPTTA